LGAKSLWLNLGFRPIATQTPSSACCPTVDRGFRPCTAKSLPPLTGDRAGESLAKAAGFSLHSGVATEAHQRNKLERVARYITRPPVAIERLSLTPQGNIKYSLKTPYRDGTTHGIFEPLDFIARLASLVPSPRVNLTRYHDLRPHARLRAQIVPSARGAQKKKGHGAEAPTPRHVAMTWTQRLKRVFLIDVTVCEHSSRDELACGVRIELGC
jgi:hypothetical protein